ncbi:hypothetical protein OUZ56_010402 [Daphnia magna]|uniref:Uncharacterized protein n=1 Tax=Daphnia magna TaxID=35525 RepID=A0ABR0AIN5_9CRUS|nr:hypothetical protein OUZ56_010402 [Daphnia magna]
MTIIIEPHIFVFKLVAATSLKVNNRTWQTAGLPSTVFTQLDLIKKTKMLFFETNGAKLHTIKLNGSSLFHTKMFRSSEDVPIEQGRD